MRRNAVWAIILFFIITHDRVTAQPGTVTLSGIIKNAETGEPIPRASVKIVGTNRGAIANTEGKYRIAVDPGREVDLRFRAIGYRDNTLTVNLTQNAQKDVELKEQPVSGQEVVVQSDASRVEARRIMHEVIRRKHAWLDKLQDFTAKAYSRWDYKTSSGGKDTVVRSVIESVADIYWKKDRGIAERITARKQTANLPPELNTFSVGEIVNFYDDRIEFDEGDLPSPLADDAFDFYDYDLLAKDVKLFDGTYAVISVESGPLTRGFTGKLWIDESDYSVGNLALTTNSAVHLGPINELLFEQRFDDIGEYQLPIDLRTVLGIKLQLPFVPQLHFEQLAVLKDYAINPGVADSFFTGRRHVALPGADSLSADQWQAERAIPLTAEEEHTYERIDTEVALARGDSTRSFIGTVLDALPSPDLPSFNQVEGLHLGVHKSIPSIGSFPLSFEGNLGYGFRDKLFKYQLSLEQGLLWTIRRRTVVSGGLSGDISGEFKEEPDVTLSIGAEIFDHYHQRGNAYPDPLTSITSLIYTRDYERFYRGRGFGISLNYYPHDRSTASIRYTAENLSDVPRALIDTLVGPERKYRSIGADLSTHVTMGGADVDLDLDLVTSSKSFASDYEFALGTLEAQTSFSIGALGKLALTGRYQTRFSGDLPKWSLFYFETRDEFFSSSGNFRTLSPFEFMGDELWMLYGEHNFYDLPMRLVGIDPPDYLDLHWFVHGGIGAAEFRSTPVLSIPTTNGKPFAEVGLGIGNIFNVIKLEGTWRLTHKKATNFYPTVSLGFTF